MNCKCGSPLERLDGSDFFHCMDLDCEEECVGCTKDFQAEQEAEDIKRRSANK